MAKATLTKFQRSLLQRLTEGHRIRSYGIWRHNYFDIDTQRITSGNLVTVLKSRAYVVEDDDMLSITDLGRKALTEAGG